MALNKALKSLEFQNGIAYDLVKRDLPTALHVDCEILWTNLMDETVPRIPGFGVENT